jgi:membrane protease YdiL (CAAX protease family)
MASASRALSNAALKFFLITFAITWTLWSLSAYMATIAHSSAGLLALLLLPGTFTPAFVAVALTAQAEGRDGVGALLHRLLYWRVGLRWYVFSVSYMVAIKLTAAAVHRVVVGSWPGFGSVTWYLMLAATVFSTAIGGQAGEEIGWRGYALPRLADRFGRAGSSVMLGVIWAVWHLPLFFITGADLKGQSFTIFLLAVPPLSVAIAWLYWHTNGSLLLTMLIHAAINNTTGIVPSSVPAANPWALTTSLVGWITIILLWICAGYFLLRMPEGPVGTGPTRAISPAEPGRLPSPPAIIGGN